MYSQRFEPMSVGQILDGAFKLYQRNFVRFIAIVAVAYVPVGLVSSMGKSIAGIGGPQTSFMVNSSSDSDSYSSDGTVYSRGSERSDPGRVILGLLIFIIGMILAVFAYYLCAGALTKSISEAYLGNNVTVGEAYEFVWPKLWSLIGATLLVGAVVMLGMFLFIVPGIIFSLWYALTAEVVVLENRRAIEGMTRSKSLTSGNLGKVFVVGLVAGLVTLVIVMVTSWPIGMIAGMLAKTSPTVSTLLIEAGSVAGNVLALPITTAASILLYYDLRIRKEGFDLEMLARDLHTPKDKNQPG